MAEKRRRKSLSMFRQKVDNSQRPDTPTNALIYHGDDAAPPSPVDSSQTSPKVRPRTLQKTTRASLFGSLRSLNSLDQDEKVALTRSDSKSSSFQDDVDLKELDGRGLLGNTVIHCGEVQTVVGSVFRKRSHYFVLTESHLIRFRSQAKAAEMFPRIPVPISRTTSRMSVGNYSELQLAAYQDITSAIPLYQVVAVYKLEDGRPFFTVEVSYVDERSNRASAMQLHITEPREAEVWTSAIRAAVKDFKSLGSRTIQKTAMKHVVNVLDRDQDYDPEHFQVFKAVQCHPPRNTGKSSSEDLTKLVSSVCYLAIGLHKIHFVPIPRQSNKASSTSLHDMDRHTSYGITTLTAVQIRSEDEFQLVFKSPLRQPYTANLASSSANEIALWIRYASDYLCPEWTRLPFVFDVPREVEDQFQPLPLADEDYRCFDRTLMAYCAAYESDASRICYTVDHHCEDAPWFQLIPPVDGMPYSALELLAVFRALRYNESFSTISFANVNLCPLRYLYDIFATDVDGLCTRSGVPANIFGHHDLPVLGQEIRALALKSRKLRRFDFAFSFPDLSQRAGDRDSCGVPEALVPLCKKSITNVDWIVLNNVPLADTDLNFLVDAASERVCHLRALEVGECGLSVHDVDVLLSTLAIQDNTMEVINISGVQGRFSPELFQREIGGFGHIRRLNLTRVQKTAGVEPLIPPEVLMTWRLEALHLSQTTLNEQTIDSISAYLACPRSDILRELYLNQCGLTGRDLAVFLRSMTLTHGEARNMRVSVSENRLKQGFSNLCKAIGQNCGPSSLTMRMIDFDKEQQFRELIKALSTNTTLECLDMAGASLPYDASEETCEALRIMFASNKTLHDLDISGEHAHLDATRFGIGLNIALRGLQNNHTLRYLRIEHQNLGLQGANTLAEVIESNSTLLEIHCEHNNINLQSFTVLVNALEKNMTLQYLPAMSDDRTRSIDKVKREIGAMDHRSESPKPGKASTSIKKTFTSTLGSRRQNHQRVTSTSSAGSYTDHDVNTALTAIDERWNVQATRLQKYLYRNYCLANGILWQDTVQDSQDKRPDTSSSISKMLDKVMLNHSPAKGRKGSSEIPEDKLRQQALFSHPQD